MSTDSQRPILVNGFTNGHGESGDRVSAKMQKLNNGLRAATELSKSKDNDFHGDMRPVRKESTTTGTMTDLSDVLTFKNAGKVATVAWKKLWTGELDMVAGSQLVGSLPTSSANRAAFIESGVVQKYQKMLHPPLTYLGDAFQYRTADGKFNNVLSPHLGQAGAPYAKTVPSQTPAMGALPDPGDVFDRLMSRQGKTRESESGLSSMLLYHATIIIHDIFRTNDKDKNISDSSSYLDLSPLYGYTEDMQRQVRDDKHKLGLLKPDTFAEDRLLRQPPGVCIMLVMYNRYHNYAATQLRRINENGRFSVPSAYRETKVVALAEMVIPHEATKLRKYLEDYKANWARYKSGGAKVPDEFAEAELQKKIDPLLTDKDKIEEFSKAYDAAWNKLDDDLFNTARLITCGIYVNISIHDYLRALMGFHQYDSTFTLDPRIAINKDGQRDAISRGIGNQVTTEFNLLYRFHCAISERDEEYTRDYMNEAIRPYMKDPTTWKPEDLTLGDYMAMTRAPAPKTAPCEKEFGLNTEGPQKFSRNVHTGLFDDQKMVDELLRAMDAKVGNFGALNVPKCLKTIEIMGIVQARKWEAGTLNDFRDFFGMPRHKDFESITGNERVRNALRDLYDHPDNVELYPGIFCEGEKDMNLDPGPKEKTFALWAAIFSDAITLVRSDRFYTVDWNTNSLTSWGMNEVTPNNDVFKSSVFHRLIQRAFPQWFPYDSLRFFHPFYTNDKNLEYAKAQGYEHDLRNIKPQKPKKPVFLKTYSKIKAVMTDKRGLTCSLAAYDSSWMPDEIAKAIAPNSTVSETAKPDTVEIDKLMVLNYFVDLTQQIIDREAYAVDDHTFQVDVTRDLAIPVVVRYIADFLGFSHRLKSPSNPKAEFSENDIYQHITNCQMKNTWIPDETKIFERRVAAKESMKFLLGLARAGHVKSASQPSLKGLSEWYWGKSAPKNMAELGMAVAQQTLKQQKNDQASTAAIVLMTALDGAYNSVLAFSSILDVFMKGLYANSNSCEWRQIQYLAMQDTLDADEEIRTKVLNVQRLSICAPIVRRVLPENATIADDEGKAVVVKKGDTIICDVSQAYAALDASISKSEPAIFSSSISDNISPINAHELSLHGLTAMIKTLAQTRNLRRGHDTQGRLKRVRLDKTTEGYANYMAPGRMREVKEKVEKSIESPISESNTQKMKDDAMKLKSILDERVLQPRIDTFLTPKWDEFVPYPTTWKLRFDGYGQSDYSDITLNKPPMPDNIPPFYQPQGPSHFGGTFADVGVEDLPASMLPKTGVGLGH